MMFSLVTATGLSSTDVTSLVPLFLVTVCWPVYCSPVAAAIAISAAISASGLIALYTVIPCWPEMIRWIAASSASCPVVNGMVVKPLPFIAAIAPPAVPSLAAYTPMILSRPSAVIACSISCCALSGDQSGVSYSLPMFTLPSSTECAPALKSAAFGSVGEPLIMTIWPRLGSPPALSASSSAWPWTLPTSWLSNDT